MGLGPKRGLNEPSATRSSKLSSRQAPTTLLGAASPIELVAAAKLTAAAPPSNSFREMAV